MHVLSPIGDALGVECTGCGHPTRNHTTIGYGLWKCNYCGSKCHSVIP